MVNNSTNTNNMNYHLSPTIIGNQGSELGQAQQQKDNNFSTQ